MRIDKKYITAFLILLITEIIIALFVHDTIIRPFVGDVLVVILLYTFVRGFLAKPVRFLPVYLFIFASAVEMAQYFQLVDRLHLRGNRVMATMIGTSFDIKDILCYLTATVILIFWERFQKN